MSSQTTSSGFSMKTNFSLGIMRNRTNKLYEIRKKLNEENSSSSSKFDANLILNDTGKTSLLGKSNPNKRENLEMATMRSEMGKYNDIFNSTNLLYEELKQNFAILQQEQQKRIIPKFDDDENKRIDKKIKESLIEITRKVKQAEKNINTLDKMKLSNPAEQELKENMKINLANKIKDFSRECKINEEKYMRNYQELVGDTTNYITEDLDGSHSKSKKDFLKLESDNSTQILRQRDEEITTLLNSITELASVFKDMQTLVHYQGTILDRIDYNIDNAKVNVQEAHKELVKTEKMMKKSCYRNSMIALMTAIFIMAIMILFKFS